MISLSFIPFISFLLTPIVLHFAVFCVVFFPLYSNQLCYILFLFSVYPWYYFSQYSILSDLILVHLHLSIFVIILFSEENCVHNVLCGNGALKWAISEGFEVCDGNGKNNRKRVLTEKSQKEWELWMDEKKEKKEKEEAILTIERDEQGGANRVKKEVEKEGEKVAEKEGEKKVVVDDDPHDTVGLICLDRNGHLACGTSTSG